MIWSSSSALLYHHLFGCVQWIAACAHSIVAWIAVRLLVLAVGGSIAYATGLLHRFLCILAEWHLSTLLNHTQVTIGCCTRMDVLRGVFAASNVVVHAPAAQDTTRTHSTTTWKSPIVARMGSVYVEMNAWQWISSCLLLCGGTPPPPLDLYTVHLRDVQVFVERGRGGTYNVLLLDPYWIVPTTNTTTTETTQTTSTTTASTSSTTASVVLDDLLDAVGRAARDGTPDTLVTHYRQRLADQLANSSTTDWRTALQQSVECVVSSIASARTTTMPQRKPGAPIVYGRIGFLRMDELRIFLPASSSSSSNATTTTAEQQQQLLPLHIPTFVLKPMELATSSSQVFSDLDDVWDVILKRLLAELATSNTGRLFQTAMHEMAEALRDNNKQ